MTGLRQGELLGLRWRDVDFDARRVRVVSPFVRGEFGDPKSAGSGRSVPPCRARHGRAPRTARPLVVPARPRPGVQSPGHGQPARPLEAVRRFKQAIVRADVHPVTFHELRHTFGARMAAAGTPLRTLQHWMGHADSKTTQVYAHYQPLPGFGSSPASMSASGRTHPESAGTVQKEQRVDIAGPTDGETRSRPIRLPAAG